MSPEEVLSRFPPNSGLGSLVADVTSPDVDLRLVAYQQATELTWVKDWHDARTPTWALTLAETKALLLAAQEWDFPLPPPKVRLLDGFHQLLTILWRNPYPELLPLIAPAYALLADARRRCALLSLLGIIGSREAAAVFADCLRAHGWPDHAYSRVFEELVHLFAFPDLLLPEIITTGPAADYVGNSLLDALSQGILKTEQVGDHLEGLASYVLTSLQKSLRAAAKHQNKAGIAWRFSERYQELRHRTSMLLDLAGYLKGPKFSVLLNQAAGFTDPRLVTYAVLALLRRGEIVAPAALEVAAASHETRSVLDEGLTSLGAERHFPASWRTWEAFAASAMTEWLLYPAELGREPDELVLEHVEAHNGEQGRVAYVWRFRLEGGPWTAGVSGPFTESGVPRPLHGPFTFSRFESWDSASPAEHLMRCLGTAEESQLGS
jgi:hypothetical protein